MCVGSIKTSISSITLEAEKGRLDYLNDRPNTNKNVLWLHVTVNYMVGMQVMQMILPEFY